MQNIIYQQIRSNLYYLPPLHLLFQYDLPKVYSDIYIISCPYEFYLQYIDIPSTTVPYVLKLNFLMNYPEYMPLIRYDEFQLHKFDLKFKKISFKIKSNP